MKRILNGWMGVALALLVSAGLSWAIPTIDTPETWTAAGVADWQQIGGDPLSNPGSGGNPGGFLQGTYDSVDPGIYQIFADSDASGGIFAGNQDYTALSGPITALFDFWYGDDAPVSLSMYFYSDTTGNEWIRPVTLAQAAGLWASYSVDFIWDGSWDLALGGGTESAFLADLLDVDRVGFWVAMAGDPSAHDIGFDNFGLQIPEPNTVFFLSAVLLSLGASFRRNVADGVRWARGLWMKA